MKSARHNILVVEDVPADYELITGVLRQEGAPFDARRIDAPDELERELERMAPDLVLCDHGSARWDSFAVLEQVRSQHSGTPFVVVSGGLDAATQQGLMARGVDECVFKHRLEELGPAIRHALRLGEERRRRRAAEIERDVLRLEIAALRQRNGPPPLVPICAECKHVRDGHGQWRQLEGYFRDEMGIRFSHGLCPECVKQFYAQMG